MRLELHPEARLELLGAVAHYESCHSGLGERFIQSIDSALVSIGESPEAWAEIEQDIRRKLTRVFPYSLLYTIEPDLILVVAVMHCHQAPGYWRSRLLGG
jgi:plasmid stabilization system protein ParE